MNQGSANFGQAMFDLFVDPNKAFLAAKENGKWLWGPLLITIGMSVLFWFWYFQTVDYPWLRDQLIALGSANATQEERDAMASVLTLETQLWTTVIGVVVFTLLIYLVQALYFLIVAKVHEEDESTFGTWFNLTAWAYFPKVLVVLVTALSYGLADNNQVPINGLNQVSLNALIFGLPDSHSWAGMANSLDLTTFWVIGLLAVGFRIWSNCSTNKAITIALLPYILVYGIWAAIKLISGG